MESPKKTLGEFRTAREASDDASLLHDANRHGDVKHADEHETRNDDQHKADRDRQSTQKCDAEQRQKPHEPLGQGLRHGERAPPHLVEGSINHRALSR